MGRRRIHCLTIAAVVISSAATAGVEVRLAETIARDAMCGSVLSRKRDRPICSESSWNELCDALRREVGEGTQDPPDAGAEAPPFSEVEERTRLFVGRVAYDVLCAPETELDDDAESRSKWDYLEAIGRHRAVLEGAAARFETGLRHLHEQPSKQLADLDHQVSFFRRAREKGIRRPGNEDGGPKPIRFTDTEGTDLTEDVCREIVEDCLRAADAARDFESSFRTMPLAALEVAQVRARLLNSLSMASWGLAQAVETDQYVQVPMWLVGDEPWVPGKEVPIPRTPSTFRIETGLSPLERPPDLAEIERVVTRFLSDMGENPETAPSQAACTELAAEIDGLETRIFEPIQRLERTDNFDGFRSAHAEIVKLRVAEHLSRGNRALVDACGQDRNALQWHRHYLRRTTRLVHDLDPRAGEWIGDLLRNTFGERVN